MNAEDTRKVKIDESLKVYLGDRSSSPSLQSVYPILALQAEFSDCEPDKNEVMETAFSLCKAIYEILNNIPDSNNILNGVEWVQYIMLQAYKGVVSANPEPILKVVVGKRLCISQIHLERDEPGITRRIVQSLISLTRYHYEKNHNATRREFLFVVGFCNEKKLKKRKNKLQD
jgi:hypothetical protein